MRRHIPALDGLRGTAVCGVLAFHLGHLRGGYLGVDLFFVLSGYLITSLLLAEWAGSGRIALGPFWARRARRLLPALLLVVGAVAAYAAGEPRGLALDALRADALATLGYVANWHSIVGDAGYWDLFSAPTLLEHTWSLAIEEQLYVLWPLVVVGVLRLGRGHLRLLLATTVALAVASWTAMALLHVEGGDTSRAYFGTDTRAGSVLVGAALATWIAWRGPIRSRALPWAGGAAAAVLAVAWASVAGTTGWLYEGGFVLFGLCGATVIASISQQEGPLALVLSVAPLRHLGTISYGVYLWHWPVFVVLDGRSTVVQLAVTLALSEVSFRLVERPIRRGSIGGWHIRLLTPTAAAAAVAAIVVATAVSPAPNADASAVARVETPRSTAPHAGVTEVLVAGDSGAWFLGEGLARVAVAHDLTVRNVGTIGCGIATAGGRLKLDQGASVPDPEGCDRWPARWADELARHQPDVALLVIAWPGIGDRLIEGEWRHPCDPVYDAHYAAQVGRAIDVLASTGAHVVVADAPYLWLPVVQGDADDRVDCLNAIYRRHARASAATVLPLADWTCRSHDECIEHVGGVELRADGVHFQGAGADVVATWAAPLLRSAHAEHQQDPEQEEGGGRRQPQRPLR